MDPDQRLAVLVGGGPAPGINGVIAAATIRARLAGLDVVGLRDGFEWIMQGDIDHVVPLAADDVSGIHGRGGSHLGTSRANPTTTTADLEMSVASLLRLKVSQLITIGGDDTAFSAMKLATQAAGRVRVAHVPKTIDNDLDLPSHLDTFGFQTARHLGVEIVQNLMVDSQTTSGWCLVMAMGRTAGHLALGIGKAAGATLTLIGEEFPAPVRLARVVDTIVGAMLKRASEGRHDGVAVIAEGITLSIDPADLEGVGEVGHDTHGHLELAEVNLGQILKAGIVDRLKGFGLKFHLVAKDIGYELRCADPIAFDMEYTRDLGCCAAEYLMAGGNAAMISIQAGVSVPVPFAEMLDQDTGRTRVRLVDMTSQHYTIARRFMTRLRREDFEDAEIVSRLAAVALMPPTEFRREFEHVVAGEPPPSIVDGPDRGTTASTAALAASGRASTKA